MPLHASSTSRDTAARCITLPSRKTRTPQASMTALAICAANSCSGKAIELKTMPGSGIISSRKPSGNATTRRIGSPTNVQDAAGNHDDHRYALKEQIGPDDAGDVDRQGHHHDDQAPGRGSDRGGLQFIPLGPDEIAGDDRDEKPVRILVLVPPLRDQPRDHQPIGPDERRDKRRQQSAAGAVTARRVQTDRGWSSACHPALDDCACRGGLPHRHHRSIFRHDFL